MANQTDMMSDFQDWLGQFREAILDNNGKAMCEASRMVISILSILRAYHPEVCSLEIKKDAQMTFRQSLRVLAGCLEKNENPDGHYKLYHRNITQRLTILEKMIQTPIPVIDIPSSKDSRRVRQRGHAIV